MDRTYLKDLVNEFWELHQDDKCDIKRYKELSFEVGKALVESMNALDIVQRSCRNLKDEISMLQEELFQDAKKQVKSAS